MNEKKFLIVVRAVVCNKDKVLLVKRAKTESIGSDTWELPGGKVDFGEELEDALVRELKEEIGISVNIGELLYTSTLILSNSVHILKLTYLCFTKRYDVELSHEHSAYLWIRNKELGKYLSDDALKITLFKTK